MEGREVRANTVFKDSFCIDLGKLSGLLTGIWVLKPRRQADICPWPDPGFILGAVDWIPTPKTQKWPGERIDILTSLSLALVLRLVHPLSSVPHISGLSLCLVCRLLACGPATPGCVPGSLLVVFREPHRAGIKPGLAAARQVRTLPTFSSPFLLFDDPIS